MLPLLTSLSHQSLSTAKQAVSVVKSIWSDEWSLLRTVMPIRSFHIIVVDDGERVVLLFASACAVVPSENHDAHFRRDRKWLGVVASTARQGNQSFLEKRKAWHREIEKKMKSKTPKSANPEATSATSTKTVSS
jgi:hypothetical protein